MIRTVNFSCLINFRVISVFFFCDQDSFFILLLYMYANHVEIKSYETFFCNKKYVLNIQSQTELHTYYDIVFVACTKCIYHMKNGRKNCGKNISNITFVMIIGWSSCIAR